MSKAKQCVHKLENAISDLRTEGMEMTIIVAILGDMIVRAVTQEKQENNTADLEFLINILKATATRIEHEADGLNSMYIDDLKKQAAA